MIVVIAAIAMKRDDGHHEDTSKLQAANPNSPRVDDSGRNFYCRRSD